MSYVYGFSDIQHHNSHETGSFFISSFYEGGVFMPNTVDILLSYSKRKAFSPVVLGSFQDSTVLYSQNRV